MYTCIRLINPSFAGMEKYLIFICLLIILFLSPLSSATGRTPRTANFRANLAEKLIRELSLFPKESAKIADSNDSALLRPVRKLVEKRFKFPFPNYGYEDPVSPEDLGHYAGYYQIQHSNAAKMFYFFFESRNSKTDPVVIWLTGGPGCSGDVALFYENGPFTIANDLSLVWNEYGWDKVSNLLYVDQPIGTGFSYSSDKRDIRHNEEGVSNDLYDFLQAFFAEHPQFVNNDFYITGESYAGHYVPAFAARVHNANKAKEGTNINLKGFAIGNGLTNPEIQYRANTDYALDMGIINKADYERINMMLPGCEAAIKLCGNEGTISCLAAQYVCSNIFSSIMAVAGKINYYDIRKKCEGSRCYDFSNMEKLLNMKSVRDSLGVGDINFTSCNRTVYLAMLVDWVRNYEAVIPALLEDGVKLLVYAGEYDLICNWLGNSRWVHAMEWSGQKEFAGSAVVPFEVDGSEAGILNSYGPLSFLKVHNAGHLVPMDQPKVALEMLKRWTQSSLSGVTGEPENMVFSI